MAEPAELLLIKDLYKRALDCLNKGVAADESGERPEALGYYKKGQQHLSQGLEIPTDGERQKGSQWDQARQLQKNMRDTLRNVTTHLTDMESSLLTTESQRSRVLMDLHPQHLYPTLELNAKPEHSSFHHIYPTLPAGTIQTSVPATDKPLPPRSPHTYNILTQTEESTTPSLPVVPLHTVGDTGDHPPAYTPLPTEGHQSLGGLGFGEHTGATAEGNGEELLFLPSGVQMFFVTPDGQVSSLSYPGYLRIIRFDCPDEESASKRPSAFLHVCDWLYPLMADTPVLLANSGIFMFPDTMMETPESYIGIVLSSELPAADREIFHDILSQLTELRVQAPEEGAGSEVINLSEKVPLGTPKEAMGSPIAPGEEEKTQLPEWSEKMAQGILAGAIWLSKGFVKGAEATGRAIHKGASKLRDHITPESTPSEVSPRVTKGLHVAKQATGGAVRVSQFLVDGVCSVATRVGDKLGPHVKKHGAKLIPESMKAKDGHPSNLDGALAVAASSIEGLSTIWTGLETGAKHVGQSVASETVKTVQYKYGDEAGDATDTAVASTINVGMTAYNIDHLGFKAFLKTTGKMTAKAMVKHHDKKDGQQAKSGTEGEQTKNEEEKDKK